MLENIYLPRCSSSSNTKDPTSVTIKSERGLKIETNIGPLACIHQAITATTPEHTIPYKSRTKTNSKTVKDSSKFRFIYNNEKKKIKFEVAPTN